MEDFIVFKNLTLNVNHPTSKDIEDLWEYYNLQDDTTEKFDRQFSQEIMNYIIVDEKVNPKRYQEIVDRINKDSIYFSTTYMLLTERLFNRIRTPLTIALYKRFNKQ